MANAWLRETETGWGLVDDSLAAAVVRCAQSGSKRSNYINRIADCLGVDLEPGMKRTS